MLDRLRADDLSPHVGTTFGVTGDGGGRAGVLRLDEVARGAHQPGAPRPHPFALQFVAPDGLVLAQGIHPLAHDVLGELDLFLVPVQPGPDGLPRYEAVFN